jgi:hypothetical protein
LPSTPVEPARAAASTVQDADPVLEWNQIFIDTLIDTNTPNSSSQRLGAIVHTAIFDAYNGIERRYTPLFVQDEAQPGASRRAAVVAAAYTAILGAFEPLPTRPTPAQKQALADRYAASLAALSDDGEDGGRSRDRGVAWGTLVAARVLVSRADDGFFGNYSFTGGTAIGQWRPIPPATGMTGLGLAFARPFVVPSNAYFQPASPRTLGSSDYVDDLEAVKALGRRTGSTRTDDQTALAPFWEGNASVHWNQAANQIARARGLSMSENNRLFAILNLSMADTAFTIWAAKRAFGGDEHEVTWRPFTAITLADDDGLPDTVADPAWLPLVTTPSHPEYPAGHPAQNGAAATVLLTYFTDQQTFRLTTGSTSRTYTSISAARSDGNEARVWGGMHYPSTIAVSDGVGETVARYVNQNAVQRFNR